MEIKVNNFFPHLKTLVEVQSAVIYEIKNAFSEQLSPNTVVANRDLIWHFYSFISCNFSVWTLVNLKKEDCGYIFFCSSRHKNWIFFSAAPTAQKQPKIWNSYLFSNLCPQTSLKKLILVIMTPQEYIWPVWVPFFQEIRFFNFPFCRPYTEILALKWVA